MSIFRRVTKCPHCGEEVSPGARICKSCGNTIKETKNNSRIGVIIGLASFIMLVVGVLLGVLMTRHYKDLNKHSSNSKFVDSSQFMAEHKRQKFPKSSNGCGYHNGYEWVDLGLSVKWATCNVGASSPSDYGNYYAWGETSTKATYDWSTYKWCKGDYNNQTKYNTKSDYGIVDNKTVLELSDDAARANWGGNWRMPTIDEFNELIDNCSWDWAGNGYNVTSKKNGNSIFLPAAGGRSEFSYYPAGSYGNYWSSSLFADYPSEAFFLYFDSSDFSTYYYYGDRLYGVSVRPVTE